MRLFHRIFLHGVLLIIVLALAVGVTFHLTGPTLTWSTAIRRLAPVIERNLEDGVPARSKLRGMLEDIHAVMGSSVAIYTVKGEVIAAAGDPLAPLSAQQAAALAAEKQDTPAHLEHGLLGMALPGTSSGAYLLFAVRGKEEQRVRFFSLLLVSLLVIALMSIPLARAVSRPVDELTRTAEAFARGDLSARARVVSKNALGGLAATMNAMAASLEQRIRLEKELLANVSHELKTPLARLRVALELSSEAVIPQECLARHLSGIEEDIRELEQLVNDLLTTSRLDLFSEESTGFPLQKEPTRLGEMLSDAAERFTRRHRGRTLTVEFPPKMLPISVDRRLLGRVVDNLLDNAVKYSSPDTDIALALQVTEDQHLITVSDRGIGVDAEDLDDIFAPFFRTEKSRSRDRGGVGLGLYFCRRVIEAHEGTIQALCRESGGLTVQVTLPSDTVVRPEPP